MLCQMPFIHGGIRGIADFVVWVRASETGAVSHKPVYAKLTLTEAKPGCPLQLCVYADAIEGLSATTAEGIHIWLGSGDLETFRVNDFLPYWHRLRTGLAVAMDAGPAEATVPQRYAHCAFFELNSVCGELRELKRVAGGGDATLWRAWPGGSLARCGVQGDRRKATCPQGGEQPQIGAD